MVWLAAVAVVLFGVVRYIFKRAVNRNIERALQERAAAGSPVSSPPTPAFVSPPAAPPRASPQRDVYRQPLLRALGYDKAKVDRLVAFERQRLPGANDEQLHIAAYERWLRDYR